MRDRGMGPAALRLPPRAVRAVLLDLDGTLVDTGGDFQAAINLMRADFDLPPLSVAEVTALVGKGSEYLVRRVLELNWPAAQVAARHPQALASYQRHYEQINGLHSHLYPGVEQGMAALREQGLRLACVTNKPHAFARTLLAQYDLLSSFDLLYGGDSWPRKKPDPQPLLQACEYFVLQPSSVLMIGDSANDAQAARAAGCAVWILPYGYNHGESVQNIDSDGIVASLPIAASQIAAHNWCMIGVHK